MDQRTQNETRYTEADSKEDVGLNSLSPEKTLWTKHLEQKLRTIVNKWDLINLRRVCMAKDTIIFTKQKPTEWIRFYWLQIL